MKSENIRLLFEEFENACYEIKGVECRSARIYHFFDVNKSIEFHFGQ